MQDIEKSITRILEIYKSAVYAKDVGAFIRLYDRESGCLILGACGPMKGRRMADGNRRLVHVTWH